MKITKTFYTKDRCQWRSWLSKNHLTSKEIWLVYYKKSSGKPRISYEDAVQEALCFGWIDGIVKGIDSEKYAQRFSPRRKGSQLSELNKERIKLMQKKGLMTKFGLDQVQHHLVKNKFKEFIISKKIIKELKKDKLVWKNFQKLPKAYKTIRIAYIGTRKDNKKEFNSRLKHFMKMTRQNKKFGMFISK